MRRAAIAAAMIVTVVLGCAVDAGHYTAVLDDLAVPDSWTTARTVVQAPGAELDCTPTIMTSCPRVIRYYHSDQTQLAAFDAAVAVAADSGFDFPERELWCPVTSGPCAFVVTKGDVRLSVNVYPPGEDDGTLRQVAEPGLVLIRMIADGK